MRVDLVGKNDYHLEMLRNLFRILVKMCLRLPKIGGNPLSRSTSEEKKRSEDIDKIIRKDRKIQSRKVKILLLG